MNRCVIDKQYVFHPKIIFKEATETLDLRWKENETTHPAIQKHINNEVNSLISASKFDFSHFSDKY